MQSKVMRRCFTRSDGIEASWRVIDPVIQGWETADVPPLVYYEPESDGPSEADDLLAGDGFDWHHGCGKG